MNSQDIVYKICETCFDGVEESKFQDFYDWMDSNNISGGLKDIVKSIVRYIYQVKYGFILR